ncbi:protein PLASTID MOVEMENT IMPAIRED 2-like isoform X2 [Andrographis paniculata]|uniref:protein PLASTID MOVEMENT IMPAIRED 2-like isoform X2 n=1 Tax=Andrographis paniculata TaxID=175694 RepID=UPI0021E7A7A0|nr:protein PLASTID MOVEMENT IMPAIRED 2-like isoform X2 [Andrographis paniculata]XP_051140197.1 protein PLASTID MOVEMENT IMPAIRED 2-like isoform X2 [Andrographis paniculata]
MAEAETSSVKAAITSYKARNSPTTNYPQQTRELRRAIRDAGELNDSRQRAEMATAEAQSELSVAKKTVRELTAKIEDSGARANRKMSELSNSVEKSPSDRKIIEELASVKQELMKLKLDALSASDDKRRAEKAGDENSSRARTYMSSIEAISKEIEGINEEHVLVELARIEAVREFDEIEAQRREKEAEFAAAMDEIRKKMHEIVRKTEDSEELEKKLAVTVSDANVLAGELKLVKEMVGRVEVEDELGSDMSLRSTMEELEVARKELVSAREESFACMAAMDVVWKELERMRNEVVRKKSDEKKTEMLIQSLNSKLLRAKAKLEAATAAEDRERSIASNLSDTLERLRSEGEVVDKERAVIDEETAAVTAETKRIEEETDAAEDRLQMVTEELKAAKLSEVAALENLKALTEQTMRNRASAAMRSAGITVSRFEYEYLTGRAAGAAGVADKKVAAALAWVEALKASEKEIELKCKLLRKECRKLKARGENMFKEEAAMAPENEFERWRRNMGVENLRRNSGAAKMRNRSMKIGTPARRGKGRVSMTAATARGTARTTTVRRRKKVMGNLAKFFGRESGEMELL